MFEPIGAIVAQGPVSDDLNARRAGKAERRTHQPVRRQSRLAGRCEGVFWRRTDRKEVRQIVDAARRYELTTRQPGARNGALGFVALEVLELFANLVSFKTGQLDPSLEFLMRKLRRSKDAIHRALKALRAHGFLDWLRRYVPTDGEGGRGPQVQQTSNAYRLSLPERARQLLGRWAMPSPVPDDFAHAQAAQAAEIAAHVKTLPLDELALFEAGDTPLGQALAKLARGIMEKKERESAEQAESPSKFLS